MKKMVRPSKTAHSVKTRQLWIGSDLLPLHSHPRQAYKRPSCRRNRQSGRLIDLDTL